MADFQNVEQGLFVSHDLVSHIRRLQEDYDRRERQRHIFASQNFRWFMLRLRLEEYLRRKAGVTHG